MRVYVAVSSGRDWKVGFGSSLAHLVNYSARKGVDLHLNCVQGSHIAKCRQLVLRDAIAGGFSHVLFVDDDMKFPFNALEKLLSHDVDIAGTNYVRKDLNNPTPMVLGIDGKPIKSIGKTGAEEAAWFGFGCILIKLDLVKEIEDPLFNMPWLPDRNDWLTEDFFFCMRMQEKGAKMVVDHDVSNQSAHIGDFQYREVA